MIEVFNPNWPKSLKLDEDDWINIYIKRKWNFYTTNSKTKHGYFMATDRPGYTLHRAILGNKSGFQIDHVNRDTSDNRRCNLRFITTQQQRMNQNKTKSKTSSKYKGVTLEKRRGLWVAQIKIDGKRIFLGYHNTQEEAALAYNKKALECFSEHANLNII